MKSKLRRILITLSLMVLAFFYGMVSHRNHLPPYAMLQSFFNIVSPPEEPAIEGVDEIPARYLGIDIGALVDIQDPEDVLALRNDLMTYFWGESELPKTLPAEVLDDYSDPRWDIPHLARIDKLVIEMEYKIDSIVYHFIPEAPDNKVILYHQGHNGDFYNSKGQIDAFLADGYSVVAFCMPLYGLNNQPTVFVPGIGPLKLSDHDQLGYLSPQNGHPIKYLVEPVIIALNYLEENYAYQVTAVLNMTYF